jgi:hypothetical protein
VHEVLHDPVNWWSPRGSASRGLLWHQPTPGWRSMSTPWHSREHRKALAAGPLRRNRDVAATANLGP